MKTPIAILALAALVPRVGAGPSPPSADDLKRIEAAAAVFPFDAAAESYGSIVVSGPENSMTVYLHPTTERSGVFVRAPGPSRP